MTSNLGARRRAPVGFDEAPQALLHDVARAVREFFPPELFNRIDAVVPFSPLTPDVAVSVTRKALSQLFSRAGLVERNVFVEVEDAAVARIAKDALRAEDGARSLTRFIEDRIGGLLVEHIARAPSALQVVRVAEEGGALRVRASALTEAEPVASSYALSGLWTKPLAELVAHLPEALRTLDRIDASDDLSALCERLRHHLSEHNRGRREHGGPLYNLEWMRVTLGELRERLERLTTASRDIALDAIEDALDAPRPTAELDRDHQRVARHRLRTRGTPHSPLGRGARWEAFSALAETHILARAIDRAALPDDGDPNAVLVELCPFGPRRQLFGWMARAYAHGRGELDLFAALTKEGVLEGTGREALAAALTQGPERLVLKLVGLCMRDYLELETGTHVWQPYAREPELLRVSVTPADRSPRALLEAHAAAPDGDEVWLPVVRRIAFDPPLDGRPATLLEVDDHIMGTSHAAYARDVADVLGQLWLLRVSRESAPPGRRPEGTTP
jgi:ATP-dependent Clp protease ATP-binding subunit ClpA/ATP-dependent Clp protease ATP-binding subunit ClpC